MSLQAAIQAADLPGILEVYFPKSGARAGKAGRVRCVWRGGEGWTGNLYRAADRWRLHDFSTNQDMDAFDVLTELVGLSSTSAAKWLRGDVQDPPQSHQRPNKAARVHLVSYDPPDLPEELLSWIWVHRQLGIPLWQPDDPRASGVGALTLDLLADWIAESLRPVLEERGYLMGQNLGSDNPSPTPK
jgi:hypothetical protein